VKNTISQFCIEKKNNFNKTSVVAGCNWQGTEKGIRAIKEEEEDTNTEMDEREDKRKKMDVA
jgi:hypothetical protein